MVDCRGRVLSFLCAILKCRLPWISCSSSCVQRRITFSVRSSEHQTCLCWSQLPWVARRVGFPSLSISSGLRGLYVVRVVARGYGVGSKRPSGGRILSEVVSVVWGSTIGFGLGLWEGALDGLCLVGKIAVVERLRGCELCWTAGLLRICLFFNCCLIWRGSCVRPTLFVWPRLFADEIVA